jgi:hypothetical protein
MTPIPPSERERVVKELGDHFAHDHLSLDEYERRVADVFRAPTASALAELTRDLPSLPAASVTAAKPVAAAVRAPRRKSFLALMSGVVRRGSWIVPARMRAVAVMGGVELDLREAVLTSPVTEIYAVAVMGGIVVTVPPNVRLEADGFAIMGGFEDQLEQPGAHDPAAPVVRVRGFALMGGVEAKVGEPGMRNEE